MKSTMNIAGQTVDLTIKSQSLLKAGPPGGAAVVGLLAGLFFPPAILLGAVAHMELKGQAKKKSKELLELLPIDPPRESLDCIAESISQGDTSGSVTYERKATRDDEKDFCEVYRGSVKRTVNWEIRK